MLPIRCRHLLALAALAAAAPAQTLVINELVAKNETGAKDQQGEFEDWVEIHNPGASAVQIGGMYLTDDSKQLTRWKFPAGTSVPARGYLCVWCDNEPAEGPLHATFKLDNEGEEVLLVATDGKTKIDEIQFGALRTDHSLARMADAGSMWVSFLSPTHCATNDRPACGDRRYSARSPNLNDVGLKLPGPPTIGKTGTLEVRGAAANGPVVVFVATAPAHIDLPFVPRSILLLGTGMVALVSGRADANGALDTPLPIPNNPWLVGKVLYLQAWTVDSGILVGSNAIEMVFCQ